MKLFITAGEPSGDRLGAALIEGLRQLVDDLDVAGVGGPLMEAQGLRSLFPMQELSVMGIAEILPKYFLLKRRIRQTAAAASDCRPDVVVTVDSPDFSFRVAEKLRRRSDVRIVQYVAPTVWAWRPGRAKRLAGLVDQVLALFPFEPPYFEAEGLRCDFVGHPIAVEPPPPGGEISALRGRLRGSPRLIVLPGSRRSEVERLAPIFGRTLASVAVQHPKLCVVVPAVAHLADLVSESAATWPGDPMVLTSAEERRAAFRLADVALSKSGTVSLELASAGVPMVVAHDMNAASRWLISRMLAIDTVTLVNLVSETRAVPEFLGRDCRAHLIAPALLDLIAHPRTQTAALNLTMKRLGRGGEAPGLRAARAVIDGLSRA